jgi:hypothetical protein
MPLNAYLLTAKSWRSKNSKIAKRTSHKSVCYIHFMHANFDKCLHCLLRCHRL